MLNLLEVEEYTDSKTQVANALATCILCIIIINKRNKSFKCWKNWDLFCPFAK